MYAKKKTLLILWGLIFLAGIGLVLVVQSNARAQQAASEAEAGTISLLSFPAEELTRIEYTYQGENVVLEYDGEVWTLENDPEYHLDQTLCDNMAVSLCSLSAKRQLTVQEGENYGLDPAELTVQVTASEQSYILYFGQINSVTGDIYLQKAGDEALYTVAASRAECFEYTKAELFEAFSPTGLSTSALEQVEYTFYPEGQETTICLQAVSQPVESISGDSDPDSAAMEYTTVWRLASQPEADLNQDALDEIFSALTGYVSGQITGNDALFGELGQPTVSVRVTTVDDVLNLQYFIGENGCYLLVEGDDSLYQVDLSVVQALCQEEAVLLDSGTPTEE